MDQWTVVGRPVVLCIDDEPEVLASIRRALRHEPYEVVTIGDPEEALNCIAARDVSVVITDQRMPGMSGTQLLRAAGDRAPRTEGVLLTAYPSTPTVVERISGGRVRLIAKPWIDEELRRTIRELLEKRKRLLASGPTPVRMWSTSDIEEPLLRIDCRKGHARSLAEKASQVIDEVAPPARGVAIILENLGLLEDSMLDFLRRLLEHLELEDRGLSVVDPSGHATGILDLLKGSGAIAVYGPEILNFQSRSLLVVEDHPETLDYWREILRAVGPKYVTGSSVSEVLAKIDKGPFDLAFVDLGVPEGGSVALAQKLLQMNPRIDIVALSSCSDLWDDRTCERLGFWRRLEKPYRVSDLLSALQEGGLRGLRA